ncbi:hypothetical protein AWC29_01205 [Mycobacterium triplex]|jgi:hypothetical protein|uniref:HIRAN domain-containing protein n=3 Tax=Mycobacterium TaxID=1763 RepID=A0A024K591_9MYCO|nr:MULTISPECIES: hypothetical protein [Mycobacterium]MCA2272547.1 hypothetical protein [Mycobacterium intracellulare]MCA2324714.1 hypothetical protein [Mycobacterium intracellulare]OBH48392.1 hypothetical protein A5690_14595 [Mycobacterium intracellulare]ORA14416.1 hypothetical protein BST14_13785 [Mycobacterium arosiense ATCC BAA-1401 = DSM 45069]ORJ52482.1 hypothetical protein B5M45_31205 [Mycobacterium simiae]
MAHSGLLIRTNGIRTPATVARLIVTRRDPDGTYRAIGFLDKLVDGTFEFAYLQAAVRHPSFVPLIGFSDVGRRYRRAHLFSAFAERVIGAKRADRPQYLASLNLAEDADSWEILTASGGYREGDTIELIALPQIDQARGRTEARFLAHGIRYCTDEASRAISALTRDTVLGLQRVPDNPVNPSAIRITHRDLHLGYVPDPLIDYVSAVISGGQARLSVVQANPPETNPHLRLLLRLDGVLRGPSPFDGPQWRTAA